MTRTEKAASMGPAHAVSAVTMRRSAGNLPKTRITCPPRRPTHTHAAAGPRELFWELQGLVLVRRQVVWLSGFLDFACWKIAKHPGRLRDRVRVRSFRISDGCWCVRACVRGGVGCVMGWGVRAWESGARRAPRASEKSILAGPTNASTPPRPFVQLHH
jgi:hypothetical protein